MDYRWLWDDFRAYMRGDSEAGSSEGGLYLTNIQQLYERPPATSGVPGPLRCWAWCRPRLAPAPTAPTTS